MYFMYVDESGDTGLGAGSSDLFILSAIIIHEAYWIQTLNSMYSIRKDMFSKHGFNTTRELHAENMLGRHRKNGPGMSRRECLLMLRAALLSEAQIVNLRSMSVIIDKRNKQDGFDVFEAAWGTLIERFESAIRANTLPHPTPNTLYPEHGFLIVDETDEKRFRDEFFTDKSLNKSQGDNIMLLGLDILPEYQGQGLGRAVMKHYCSREQAKGRRRLVLTCLENLVGMYTKFGYTDLGISGSEWGGEEWHEMEIVLND